MIVYKQLTISIKKKITTKSKFDVARINKMLQYTVNMTMVYCLFFSAFIETFTNFQEIHPPFSMLNAKRFELIPSVHHVYENKDPQ